MGLPAHANTIFLCAKGASKVLENFPIPAQFLGMDLVEQARRIAPTLSRGTPAVYILRLSSGILYIGTTLNLHQRMSDHIAGIGCKTTRDDPPKSLLLVEPHPTFPAARKREAQIKRWSRAKKEALTRGDMELLRNLSKSRD